MLPEDIDVVARAIADVTAPLLARLDALEARPAQKGEKGDPGPAGEPGAKGLDGTDGKDGLPGKDGASGFDGNHGTDGKDGRDGIDGKDGKDGLNGKDADPEIVKALVAEAVQKALALIPVAKDGKDGLDGKDGRDGLPGQPGRDGEKGVDGLHGKDGADGLGFGDLVVEQDGERGVVVKAVRGETSKTLGRLTIPALIYRSVWRQATYEPGDVVTWAGAMWHCNETTTDKPGDGSKAWTLCVKKGTDGRVGPEGKGGPQGPKGDPGPMGPARY